MGGGPEQSRTRERRDAAAAVNGSGHMAAAAACCSPLSRCRARLRLQPAAEACPGHPGRAKHASTCALAARRSLARSHFRGRDEIGKAEALVTLLRCSIVRCAADGGLAGTARLRCRLEQQGCPADAPWRRPANCPLRRERARPPCAPAAAAANGRDARLSRLRGHQALPPRCSASSCGQFALTQHAA
jgi:hypothetical protein